VNPCCQGRSIQVQPRTPRPQAREWARSMQTRRTVQRPFYVPQSAAAAAVCVERDVVPYKQSVRNRCRSLFTLLTRSHIHALTPSFQSSLFWECLYPDALNAISPHPVDLVSYSSGGGGDGPTGRLASMGMGGLTACLMCFLCLTIPIMIAWMVFVIVTVSGALYNSCCCCCCCWALVVCVLV